MSGAVNAAVNATVNAVNTATTGAANAVTNAANAATNAANDLFKTVNTAANNAANAVSQNIPLFNSLIPIGNSSSGPAANKPANNVPANKPANNVPANKPANNVPANKPANAAASAVAAAATNTVANLTNSKGSSWLSPLYMFGAVVILFLILFSVFNTQIKNGYEYIAASIKKSMGLYVNPDIIAPVQTTVGVPQVTVTPQAPQDMTPTQQGVPSSHSIVERILPPSGEVFNVAQNKFTYYDAEPLCKALGAELATYEQVKDAWGNGADWCNYGWVKGQMAIYPTQKGTYDKLQSGPADQRGACGTVGINGGYFDNPEFKYGVNCYGQKPSQSAHDQQELMSEGKAPRSPETLKVDKMVADFKDEADSLFVKPFNDQKWAAS